METVETEELRKYCVYLITNLVNGKQYAGQTGKRVSTRWVGHTGDANRGVDRHLHHAIRFYGKEKFEMSVIKDHLTKEEADLEERYVIKSLDLMNPSCGYNMTSGGEGAIPSEETRKKLSEKNGRTRRDLCPNEIVRLYRGGLNTHQIAKNFAASPTTIGNKLREVGTSLRNISDSHLLSQGAKVNIDEILCAYREGKSTQQIAEKLGTSAETIRHRLIAADEPRRSRGYRNLSKPKEHE